MADKDVAGILQPLRGLVASVHATAADNTRALPPDQAAALAEQVLEVPAVAHPSVVDALAAAPGDEPLLVMGSIYVVGDAREALGIA